jgi:hypothetical protein
MTAGSQLCRMSSNIYNGFLHLGLSPSEKAALVEYPKSL